MCRSETLVSPQALAKSRILRLTTPGNIIPSDKGGVTNSFSVNSELCAIIQTEATLGHEAGNHGVEINSRLKSPLSINKSYPLIDV